MAAMVTRWRRYGKDRLFVTGVGSNQHPPVSRNGPELRKPGSGTVDVWGASHLTMQRDGGQGYLGYSTRCGSQALGCLMIRCQKFLHGWHPSSSCTASNGTLLILVAEPPVQTRTWRLATSTTT
jgi:hypothetical protein